jgi:cell division protein FtsQ
VWPGGCCISANGSSQLKSRFLALSEVDLPAIQKDVEAIAEVQSATVERGWPHTVLVTIKERKPVAIALSRGGYVLVDDRGYAAGPKVKKAPKGFTVIEGVASTPGMESAVAILQEIPRSWKIDSIGVSTQDSVVVHLKNGADITFGSGDNAKQKVRVAVALLANKYKVIDVSAPDAPTVRKRK